MDIRAKDTNIVPIGNSFTRQIKNYFCNDKAQGLTPGLFFIERRSGISNFILIVAVNTYENHLCNLYESYCKPVHGLKTFRFVSPCMVIIEKNVWISFHLQKLRPRHTRFACNR